MTELLVGNEVRWLRLNTADITGGQNPAVVGVLGTGVAGGYSNSVGSVNARNLVQTWNKVNMREVVGTDWANKYKTFGMRPVYINWAYHEQYWAAASTRFLRISIAGLPWVNAYDTRTKGRKADQVIVTSIPNEMSINSARVYTMGYGPVVFPACEFQLISDVDYYDLTISYTSADGSAIVFSTTAGQAYALPTCAYGFIIWPIVPKKAKIETHGYPLQKTKRLRLEGEEEDGDLS